MDFSRLRLSLLLLLVILTVGTVGYTVIEDMPVFEAFYMTIITMSTVGFSEIKPLTQAGRWVTIFVIVTGISTLTYVLGQMISLLLEGELQRLLGRRKLVKQIESLSNHYIVCGYGRIGRIVCTELLEAAIPFIVVEANDGKIAELDRDGRIYLIADATMEEALKRAGIMRARGLVTAVREDANNVFITLTAKGLRPDIFVLSRASEEKNQEKMMRAGASRVVCPYLIGGRRMAQVIRRPTVVDFIDDATTGHPLGLTMEETVLSTHSPLAGKSILESNVRSQFGVMIVAIKRPSKEMVFAPNPNEVLNAGETIVFLGREDDLHRVNALVS
ncbi:MAG: NAD-binding protein [Pseudomonadota bacterium]